jgi:DNA-directed RNA polymerase specialized sigma24 family protein
MLSLRLSLPAEPTVRESAASEGASEESSAEADGVALFVVHMATIEAVLARVARRHHLRAEECDEFSSRVKEALLERNAEKLRRHDASGSMAAFLHVVIERLFFTYRNERWGRWRPSAAARRHGPVAVLLERLTCRDGLSFDSAVETARVNHGVSLTPMELWQIFTRLTPTHVRWRPVDEAAALEVPSADARPDAALLMRALAFERERIFDGLEQARGRLPAEDRLILKMRIDDGWSVSRIASALGLNQRKLYTRFDKLYRQLRDALLAAGISTEDVSECLGQVD